MCGRYAASRRPDDLVVEFEAVRAEGQAPLAADYNVAPTKDVYVVRHKKERDAEGRPTGGGHRELRAVRWGLVPSWAKDASMGARLINARSETVAEKPAFREAFKRRRCVIPADGFYEWRRADGKRQPFFFQLKGGGVFGFAGLWERWEGGGGEVVNSCAILTTEANDVLRPVHDRMPVILHPEEYELWLGADARERSLLQELLRPYPSAEMTAHPVSTLVNSPRSQGRELVEQAPVNSA